MWMVRRSYEEFRTLDAHLHQCIYDRRYSQLLPLPPLSEIGDRVEVSGDCGRAYLLMWLCSILAELAVECFSVLYGGQWYRCRLA